MDLKRAEVNHVSYVAAIERQAVPAPAPRPLAAPAYLLLPVRELAELMRAQSLAALEMTRRSFLEVPSGSQAS